MITGTNTYTGTTIVKAGTLEGNLAAAESILGNSANGGDLQGGRVVFDYPSGFNIESLALPYSAVRRCRRVDQRSIPQLDRRCQSRARLVRRRRVEVHRRLYDLRRC